MSDTKDHNFDFLSEIRKENTYNLLFPDPKAGLTVFALYKKILDGTFSNRTFKESDIHQAIKEVNPRQDSPNGRYPIEYYTSLISDLQEYFLRYDEDKQVYMFKEYAYDFCKRASDILKANFDPTRIEKICFSLKERLQECVKQNTVLDWFSIEYSAFQPDLRQQIDYLDRQIDHSVLEVRQTASLRDKNIIEALKQIDNRLDNIRKQNTELRSAFREIDVIKKILEDNSMETEDKEIGDLSFEALKFFQEMKGVLSLVDARLDRIQPKIKQLFSTLNKPLFNMKVERFLNYLLDKSEIGKDANKKKLYFPSGMDSVAIHGQWQDLTIVEKKPDLFPSQSKQRFKIIEDEESKQKAFARYRNKLIQQDDISLWINRIKNDLETSSSITFSNYFFEIIEVSQGGLELAIAVTYRLLKEFYQDTSYLVQISPEITANRPNKNVLLWEMTIQVRK